MEIKKTFTLNKGVPNLLHLSKNEISTHSVESGLKLAISSLDILQKSVEHFSKNSVYKQISPELKNEIAIIYLEQYPLHVSYNIPTRQIIINLFPFGTDTITNVNPEPRNIYACIAYGICFKKLLEGKVVPKSDSREMGSASDDNATIAVDIGVMKRLQNSVAEEKTEVDELLELCEEIKSVLNRQRFASDTAICVGTSQEIIYSVEDIDNGRVFLTAITATFATTVAV